jgi:homoserine kinase type II
MVRGAVVGMAVYTDVSDEELSSFVAAYDIGMPLSFKGIAEGVENTNYLLHAEGGRFILTLYEKRTKSEDLPFFLGLMRHLASKGVRCPMPIVDRQGESLKRLAGRPAAMMSFLDGVSVRRPSAEQCATVGAALAALHEASADYELARPNAMSVMAWRPLIAAVGERADEVALGLAEDIEDEMAFLERHWPSDLPRGVIHADLFPNNVLFIGKQVSGLIDFYFAANDAYAYDLAICLNAWCFEADHFSLNITKARALVESYSKIRPLADAEKAAFPLLSRGAAMRFLATRLYDWINTPPGALVKRLDPVEYWRKNRFHRRMMSPADYGL